MARLIRPLRKTISSHSLKTLLLLHQHPKPTSLFTSRNYISDTQKSAFNILRLLRNEIQYENERCSPKQVLQLFAFWERKKNGSWIKMVRCFILALFLIKNCTCKFNKFDIENGFVLLLKEMPVKGGYF